jgi:methionyl-tRNA formyltransferase
MRAVIYSMIPPAILGLAEAARGAGLEPVAVLTPRDVRSAEDAERRAAVVAETPDDIDVCLVADKADLARLTAAYEPAIGLCAGYRWLLPPEVLAIPTFGVVNSHPALLPRHRGPFPFAWAIREADAELGLTLHLMDAEFDTGPVLAQGSRPMPSDQTIGSLVPVLQELARELYPDALRRVLAGERGDPQRSEGATWAGPFGKDYAELDPLEDRAALLRQVRAWQVMFDRSVVGPVATIEGRRLRVQDATLDEPDDPGTLRLDATDGPLWLTSVEQL